MGLFSSNNDVTLKVGFDIDKFQKELQKTNQHLTSWSSTVTSSLKGVVAGFSALSLGEFVLDAAKLAGEAEGVRAAFEKLPASVQLMNDLKKATSGTVSELDLMKRAVMASNFDISLKALPQLLEFATVRAKQTGQSIDYLVDSIVTGIGRKSKLILDNLGISAVQLTEALGGASTASSTIGEVAEAVGKIASKSLEQMGTLSENTSTKLERLSASWVNVKVAIGDAANANGILGRSIDSITDSFNLMASNHLSFWEKFASLISPAHAAAATVKNMTENLREQFENTQKSNDAIETANYFMGLYKNDLDKIKEALNGAADETLVLAEVKRQLAAAEQKASDEAEEFTTKLKEQKTAIEQLRSASSQKYTFDRMQGVPLVQSPGFKLQSPKHTYAEDIKALRELQTTGEDVTASVTDMSDAWANLASIVGESIGDMRNGTQTFAQAMAQMASRVIDYLFQIALAQAAVLSAKLGPAALPAFALSAGILKSIFSNIGRGNISSGMTTATGRAYGGGMNLMIDMAPEAAKWVTAKLETQSVRDSRSKVR